jgi:4-amino-4-deoxy-L-arabinose transferase-like glycosyltransferase
LWYLNGWGNEGLARTPMVITGLLLIPAMFALGKRMSGGREAVGLLAAGLVALNGFFVAYARHVENQSLIVFWGALAMWLAYRYWREQRLALLPWLGLALAVGLIAHPDMLLYLPVFGYVVWQAEWPHRANWRQRWPWLAGSGLLLVGLVALFYIPYLTDPDIGLVYQYFGSDRIGTGLFYNRVANLFDQDKLYSTRYHAPLLVLLLLWLLTRHFAGWGRWGLAALAGLAAAIVSTVAQPDWWQWGAVNVAFAPYALLTLLILLMPHAGVEIKTLILWFSVPLGALLFLAKDAADHVQVAYTGWAMLAALSLADLWQLLGRRRAAAWLKPALAASLAVVAGLILAYQYLAFDSTVTAYWQAKLDSANNPNSRYNWLYGSLPRPRKIFSNPRLGGWKVAGYLWQTGALSGDFRSINESFAVPVWYTFQTPRSCYEDPQHYWVRRDWQGWPDEAQTITEQGYTLTRVVLVDGQPKLHLYEKTAGPREPETLNLDDFRHKFDRLATPARFAQAEPISQPASFNFGDRLLLRGYDPPPQIAKPGDLLPVTVYWDTLARMDVRYRGFVHLVGANGVPWGQHDDDPACRLLTTDMRPGQQSSRQFRLPVVPNTPPGQYTVVFGLYHPDNFERLPIWDNLAGQPAGNSLVLGTVTIK